MSIRDFDAFIRESAGMGLTMRETAECIGYHYATVAAYAAAQGITFTNSKSPPPVRNEAIIADFQSGLTLEAIGQKHGVTRERVRQITLKAGMRPRYEVLAEQREPIIARIRELAGQGKITQEIADVLGIPYMTVYSIAKTHGIKIRRRPAGHGKEAILAEIRAKVEAGMSIRQACGEDRKLAALAARRGIVKSRHGRWRDFNPRRKIVAAMQQIGASWADMAEYVGKVEGATIRPIGLYHWAHKRGLVVKKERKPKEPKAERVPNPPKPPVTPRVYADVERGSTIRDTCIANYGKAPASRVAKELGITRNAVIGHWFRARKSGEIRT